MAVYRDQHEDPNEQIEACEVTTVSRPVGPILVATLEDVHECVERVPVDPRKAPQQELEALGRIEEKQKQREYVEDEEHEYG